MSNQERKTLESTYDTPLIVRYTPIMRMIKNVKERFSVSVRQGTCYTVPRSYTSAESGFHDCIIHLALVHHLTK